ncbi:hypothetical protein jhhlp_000534 [Lomentospora prolificans]|uniref:Enoyl-CoA hydratase n=1 Tax=Lomentospora prolificans TaxID=41688 RepID=A0A2N3NL97_9PEZI|nr:hypothetical protein jhhlp_000534 [Lomentospora prolificans]
MAVTPNLVVVSAPTAKIRVLTLNRPQKRNALSQALIQELLDELSKASKDPDVRAVVLTGGDTFFSAGADIGEIAALDGESARKCRYLENLCHGIASVQIPILAAVEGIALGGGFELALMCDMIIASNTATFGFPEVKIGLIPGAGGTQRLTNVVGKYRAMEMILLGNSIGAEEASKLGLVSRLVPANSVLKNAIDVAKLLAEQSPSAVLLAKEAICRADELGRDDRFERSLYYAAFGTQDKIEGTSSFLEKRVPKWR